MGGENSAGDLLTMRTLKIQTQPLVNPDSIILTPEDGLRWRNLLVNLAQELFPYSQKEHLLKLSNKKLFWTFTASTSLSSGKQTVYF